MPGSAKNLLKCFVMFFGFVMIFRLSIREVGEFNFFFIFWAYNFIDTNALSSAVIFAFFKVFIVMGFFTYS